MVDEKGKGAGRSLVGGNAARGKGQRYRKITGWRKDEGTVRFVTSRERSWNRQLTWKYLPDVGRIKIE
jgi:hypothetical protein